MVTKQENTLLLTPIESSLCIVGSPSHEFIINAFYDEGTGLGPFEKFTTKLCIIDEINCK